MGRIRFREGSRKFFNLVILKTNSPSLRGLLQFGIGVPYSTLKNYYNGDRLVPEELFEDLCEISKIDKFELDFEYVWDKWGQVKGGKKSKRGKI
jgi:hypothetical protein